MTEPRWIDLARSFIGITEIHGSQHNPEILQFWRDIKRGGIKDDETPWCAALLGAVLERSGIPSSRFGSARSYLKWGIPLQQPVYGCVVVLTRNGGGHVGFVVSRASNGHLLVLGGNQGDEVSIKAFPLDRVAGYRWPAGEPCDFRALPIGGAALSGSEA